MSKPLHVEDEILIQTELKLRELFDDIELILKDPKIKNGTTFDIETKFSRIVVLKK